MREMRHLSKKMKIESPSKAEPLNIRQTNKLFLSCYLECFLIKKNIKGLWKDFQAY